MNDRCFLNGPRYSLSLRPPDGLGHEIPGGQTIESRKSKRFVGQNSGHGQDTLELGRVLEQIKHEKILQSLLAYIRLCFKSR